MKQAFSMFIVAASTLLATTVLEGQILWNDVGHIPQSSQIDWTNAGLLSGTSFDAVDAYDVTDYGAVPNDGQNDYNAIMAAVNAAQGVAGLSVVYFPAGTYNVNSIIHLSRIDSSIGYSDIVLQGAGSDQTILQFTVGSTNHCINVYGIASGGEYDLTDIVPKGSTQLDLSDLSTFNVNDWIHLCEQDFPYGEAEDDVGRFVGQITQLSTIGAGQATMKDEASKEYRPEYTLWIQKLYPIMNVGIENLKIQRMDQDPVTWEDGNANINFNYAVNCWIRGVESDNATYAHLIINHSSQIEISGNYFHHARSYGIWDPPFGVEGTGYGMLMGHSSTNCLVENNIFKKVRHAMLLRTGANSNVLTYNYSRESEGYTLEFIGDINLHGRYPYANLFEHNFVEFIEADDTHDLNGPYNAFVRNIAQDHEGVMHTMVLVDAENTSVLGCELRLDETYTPIVTAGNTSLSADLYGILIEIDPPYNTYETGILISHSDLAENWYYFKSSMHLHDVSYYYSQRPAFLNSNYTFPSIGPEFTSQNIPAKDRYNGPNKTYLANPTLKPLTTSGIVEYDQIWPDGHTLTGNVLISDNTFILVEDGATINLNGYNIAHLGSGQIIREGAATFLPYDIRLKNGSTITGQYSSIYLALTHSIAGQEVVELAPATYTFNNNLTVASGKTLRPLAGTTLNFNGNYKLRVEGTLTADGTSSNKITFTRSSGAWYGIELYNSMNSQISYSNIHNAQYGLRAINSYPALSSSSVKYNTVGVRFENNSLAYGGVLQGNVIAENSSDGVQCFQYSDPGIGANNLIRYNNFYGVYGDAGSIPNLGASSSEGYNSIYYNGTEVWSAYSGTIYARYNWWGDANPTPNVSGNVVWSNHLTFDPNSGMGKPLAGDPSNKDSENQLSGASEADTLGMAEVDLAYKIFLGGEYDEALSRFEAIVGKYPDNFSSRRALVFVTRCLDRLNRRNESLSRTAQLVQNFAGKEVYGLAQSLAVGELVKSGQYAEAVAQSQEIVNNFPGTTLAKYALYDLGSIHWYRLEDEKAGESYFRQLIAAWPEDDLTISALATLGEWKPGQGKGSQPGFAGLESVPRSYELAQNFPNPFNPQTEILYQLPEPGRVSLKIYDLLGKEVRTLVEEFREAGYHQVIWDGRDNANRTVPSGVYLRKLAANGFVQTKRWPS